MGKFAKLCSKDKEIINNSKAWVKKFGEVETGQCIVTNKGKIIKNDGCYYIFHAIAPVYSDITKDSCIMLLKQSVVTCLETA